MDYKKNKKLKKLKIIILVSFGILSNGIYIITRNHTSVDLNIEKENQEYYQNNQEETSFEEGKTVNNTISILEIPKINLKQQLPEINSSENDVNKNIFVVKETIFPSTGKKSHIILAAHSGYNKIAFFKRLPELSKDDIINFYYQNKKYTYKVIRKKEIEKNGTMTLEVTSSDDITLITCLKGTNKQIVYQGILTYTSNL